MTYLICDLDGTMIDSAPVVTREMAATLRDLAGVELPQSKLLTFLGPPLSQTIGSYAPAGLTADDMIAYYRKRYISHEHEVKLFPEAQRFLKLAKEAGHKLAVATAKLEVRARKNMRYCGVADYFDIISGAPDDHIPDKAKIIQRVLEHWDFPDPDDVFMIGDRIHDIQGANANNLRTVIATWGQNTYPDEVAKAWGQAANADELMQLIADAPNSSISRTN